MEEGEIDWQEWFDHLGDPLFVVDEDHKILKANEAAAELLGEQKEEIEGSYCHQLVHNSPEPPDSCPLESCIRGEGEGQEEFYEPHLDKYLRARIFPAASPDSGEKQYCTHQLQDITERKEREEKLASYPERNPHPVIEWGRDMELKFANDSAEKLLNCAGDTIEVESGRFGEHLPEIRKEFESTNGSRAKPENEEKSESVYREITFPLQEEERVYGFYFHYLNDQEAIRAYGFDVTERHHAEKELQQVNRDLELLIKINQLIVRVEKRSELLDRACRVITDVGDYPLVWVGRKEEGPKKRVVPVAHAGFEEDYLNDLDVRWSRGKLGQGPTGRAIRNKSPQVKGMIPDEDDSRYQPWREEAGAHGFGASIALPITLEDEEEVYGALNIYSSRKDAFSGSRMELLEQLADDLGYGLQYIDTRSELEKTTIGTLKALSRTVEAKDEYTGEHIDRVQKYALKLGERMGMTAKQLDQLKYASELHDVGKVRIPDSILGKPSELTDEEWDKMEKHPEVGEEIVGAVPRLEGAANIVGQHQEKYDGTGYPKGLKGEEITLGARIIAVVDAWDAMRTDRPYRDALPREVALEELNDNSGTQFDPEVVETFLDIIEERT